MINVFDFLIDKEDKKVVNNSQLPKLYINVKIHSAYKTICPVFPYIGTIKEKLNQKSSSFNYNS